MRASSGYFREVIISSLVRLQLLLITSAKMHLIRVAEYKRPVAILTSFQSEKESWRFELLITKKTLSLQQMNLKAKNILKQLQMCFYYTFFIVPTASFTYIRFKTILYSAKVEEYVEVDSTTVSHDDYDHETLCMLNILLQAFPSSISNIIALQFNQV